MKEKSIAKAPESRPVWESLEAFAWQGIQRLLQELLREEVEQALGQRRYERRDGGDAAPGYRNGLGKPRRLSAMAGTITVNRPRVRGLEMRFESQLLPLLKQRTEELSRLRQYAVDHGPDRPQGVVRGHALFRGDVAPHRRLLSVVASHARLLGECYAHGKPALTTSRHPSSSSSASC